MNPASGPGKEFRRLLHFLDRGPATVCETSSSDRMLLEGGDRGTISVNREELATMMRRGILAISCDKISISPQGRRLAGEQTAADPFCGRQRQVEIVDIDTGEGLTPALANLAESPLAQLARRKGKNGKAFLSPAEIAAGERLRSDYTRGQIMPRLGANWIASVASGKRDGAGGLAELTDAALSARQRVDRAVAAVGPELSGVLIDVCCFLKGLEIVEMERGWPVRSAKVMLKTALGVLSRHYHPGVARQNSRAFHWGAEDYRPTISP